jgi:hypothetical protein
MKERRNRVFNLLLFGSLQLPSISPNISEIEHQVGGDQHGVEHIEPDDDVVTVQRLVDDAEDVAQDDERHKDWAFADYDFGAQRFGDGQWPADRETKQEQDFPDAEMWHNVSFFSELTAAGIPPDFQRITY